METKLEQATAELVKRDFEIEANGMEELRNMLSLKIETLMNENPTLLKSIFYRIDLNESQLGMALVSLTGKELFLELAQQVIDRMQKKAEWRIRSEQ